MKQQGEHKVPPWLAAFLKSKYALFALGLAGILLIFFSELPGTARSQTQGQAEAGTMQSAGAEYAQEMEEKLTRILQQVDVYKRQAVPHLYRWIRHTARAGVRCAFRLPEGTGHAAGPAHPRPSDHHLR